MNNYNNSLLELSLGTEYQESIPDGEYPAKVSMGTETSYGNDGYPMNIPEPRSKPLEPGDAQVKTYLIKALNEHSNRNLFPDEIEAVANEVINSGFLRTYEVDVNDWEQLGSGSCGLALPVRHRNDRSRQYLKIIPPNPNANYDFKNEYQALKSVDNEYDHPINIVSLKDYEVRPINDTSSVAILLMEELEPLTDPITSYDELLKLAVDVCAGLVFLQSHRIIHRDIKPENIMRRRRGSGYDYVIIDLGLLVRSDENGKADFDGMVVSDEYGPREFANAVIGEPLYDFTTDLYMLGITLLCMITGFDPAERGDLLSCIRTDIQADASDFSCEYLKNHVHSLHAERLRPPSGAGVNLERIIEIMCSNSAANRPADARTLLSWLIGESWPDHTPISGDTLGSNRTEYHYPINDKERQLRKHWITSDGLIEFPNNHYIHRSDFDYCRTDKNEHHSILAQYMGELGVLVNKKLPHECGKTVTAFDVTLGHNKYILRCINCTDPEGKDSSKKHSQNLTAYRDGLMDNRKHTCVDKVVDMMYVKYRTDRNGGYKGNITKDNHYLFTLSETYDYGLYVSLDSLIQDYGDDYDSFSVAERCAICYKVINTMNTLHKYMVFHGSLTPDNIYVRRNPSALGSPEVKIVGFGSIDSTLSADDKTLVRTLVSTLTSNGKIPLEILPSQTTLREYFIGLIKRVEESDRTGEWFTIEQFNSWYETNYHRSPPIVYSTVSDIIRFVGNDSQPLADYTVTILKETRSVEETPMSKRTVPYTRLSVMDEWGVDIRLFVRKDFDGVLRLYAACLDHADKELLIGDHPFSTGSEGEMLMNGTRITCMRKGLFGRKKIGQITVISPRINN